MTALRLALVALLLPLAGCASNEPLDNLRSLVVALGAPDGHHRNGIESTGWSWPVGKAEVTAWYEYPASARPAQLVSAMARLHQEHGWNVTAPRADGFDVARSPFAGTCSASAIADGSRLECRYRLA